jgi:hypothetical protein
MDERDILMARESAIKAATTLTDIDERLGYFKQKGVTEDTMARFLLYYNKIYEQITENKQPNEDFQTPKKPAPVEMSITPGQQQISSKDIATEKQINAIDKFLHWHPELAEELECDPGVLTKAEASSVLEGWINRFPKKQK